MDPGLMGFARTIFAATTPDDVFKSMGDSMGSDVNVGQVLAVVVGIVGLIVLVSLFKRRADASPKSAVVNQPSRLLRDIAREVGLKRRDVRELKKLATLQGVNNPVTLLLCPSLMQAALAKRNAARPIARG